MQRRSDHTKFCAKCKVVKNAAEFTVVKKTGLLALYCKVCTQAASKKEREADKAKDPKAYAAKNRDSALRSKYGISLLDYEEILEVQEGHCAICPTTPAEERLSVLVVDHNHDTGEVRGLLCNACNTAIGLLKDDPVVATSAAKYLVERGNYSK